MPTATSAEVDGLRLTEVPPDPTVRPSASAASFSAAFSLSLPPTIEIESVPAKEHSPLSTVSDLSATFVRTFFGSFASESPACTLFCASAVAS